MSARKPSYANLSIADVAKILNTSTCFVRMEIDKGKLRALGADIPKTPGKRRFLQIRKDDLRDYLRLHRSTYDMELLRAYGIKDVVAPEEIPDEVKAYYAPTPEKKEINPDATCTVSDISQLDGAWAPEKLVDAEKAEETYKKAAAGIREYAGIRLRETTTTCSVIIDGRIAVANISYDTAVKIVEAMMCDQACVFKSITIEKVLA